MALALALVLRASALPPAAVLVARPATSPGCRTIVSEKNDTGEWNAHIFVIGGQYSKAFDFFRLMKNVSYRIDNNNIIDNMDKQIVPREEGYGYGIVIKAWNPFYVHGSGVAFLIAGFGTLGTAAASYYFREHYESLGRQFKKHCLYRAGNRLTGAAMAGMG